MQFMRNATQFITNFFSNTCIMWHKIFDISRIKTSANYHHIICVHEEISRILLKGPSQYDLSLVLFVLYIWKELVVWNMIWHNDLSGARFLIRGHIIESGIEKYESYWKNWRKKRNEAFKCITGSHRLFEAD